MTEEQLNWIKNRADLLLKKMNSNQITKEEYRELQVILIVHETVFRDIYPTSKISISGDRAIFIADTHIGNIYENLRLVYAVYNIALQNNIKLVFHLGDLIESTANIEFRDDSEEKIRHELERAKESIPREIKTKLLLGNHDYSAIRTFPNLIHEYFDNDRLEILGMKEVIINWDNFASISLYHEITQLKNLIKRIVLPPDLALHAHWHNYEEFLSQRKINLPNLCKSDSDIVYEDIPFYHINLNHNIFLLATRINDYELLLELYTLNHDNTLSNHHSTILNTKQKTLRKVK